MSTVTRPPRRVGPPAPGPRGREPTEPPGEGLGRRLLLGAVILVLLSAVASGVYISGELSTLTKAISQNQSLKSVPGALASAPSGAPQTLLLVGDDQRALTQFYHHAVLPHSNEMLLVRFDPGKPFISMLSIPRDLQATIYPPHAPPVTTRFNYAYTAGGIPLLLSTIKRVIGLSVNHVVVITFAHFQRAINEMGCVYSTIDHRYFHSNVGSAEQYQEINLQPGYQRLCGPQALQFVSYRHGDTALVRDARNQTFLLDVKNQFGPTLFSERNRFEGIFGRAVQTDAGLHTTSGILDLLQTLVSSAGRPVRQVPFQANLLPNSVTASPLQISATVNSFLHGRPASPKKQTAATARSVRRSRGSTTHLALVPTPPSELAQAHIAARGLPFPLEYPRLRFQPGAAGLVTLRDYSIRAQNGVVHRAYVAAIPAGALDQYYDVQGTTWTAAPLFNNPEQTIRVGARDYYIYYDGDSVKMVAWHEQGAVYWVRNSLTKSVGNRSMLAIAEATQPFVPVTARRKKPGAREAAIGALALPAKPQSSTKVGLAESLGSLGGLIALIGMAALSRPLIRHRRQLIGLRSQMSEQLNDDAGRRPGFGR